VIKTFFFAIGALSLLAFGSTPLSAQAPTPGDLTLHPGDKITWSPLTVHRLRFGGSVTHNNGSLALTPFADVQKVLTFDPLDPPFDTVKDPGGDFVRAGEHQTVTATVNPPAPGVSEFFFTCGFNPGHANVMVTVSFKIEAAPAGAQPRNVQITTGTGLPLRWVLKTPDGDKSLSRP
jgi:hypothetical protein